VNADFFVLFVSSFESGIAAYQSAGDEAV